VDKEGIGRMRRRRYVGRAGRERGMGGEEGGEDWRRKDVGDPLRRKAG